MLTSHFKRALGVLIVTMLVTGCAELTPQDNTEFQGILLRVGLPANTDVWHGDFPVWDLIAFKQLLDSPDDYHRFLTDDDFAIKFMQLLNLNRTSGYQDYTLHTLTIEDIEEVTPPATPNLGS